MSFFNVIFTMTNEIADNIAKQAQVISKRLLGLDAKSISDNLYLQKAKTDKEKIASDFRRIGKDMYTALDKYEAKHGY